MSVVLLVNVFLEKRRQNLMTQKSVLTWIFTNYLVLLPKPNVIIWSVALGAQLYCRELFQVKRTHQGHKDRWMMEHIWETFDFISFYYPAISVHPLLTFCGKKIFIKVAVNTVHGNTSISNKLRTHFLESRPFLVLSLHASHLFLFHYLLFSPCLSSLRCYLIAGEGTNPSAILAPELPLTSDQGGTATLLTSISLSWQHFQRVKASFLTTRLEQLPKTKLNKTKTSVAAMKGPISEPNTASCHQSKGSIQMKLLFYLCHIKREILSSLSNSA